VNKLMIGKTNGHQQVGDKGQPEAGEDKLKAPRPRKGLGRGSKRLRFSKLPEPCIQIKPLLQQIRKRVLRSSPLTFTTLSPGPSPFKRERGVRNLSLSPVSPRTENKNKPLSTNEGVVKSL